MKRLMVLFTVLIFFLMSYVDSSVAQVTWMKNPNNPVFSPGEPGEWDAGGHQVDAVIFDDTTYHMWYTGSQSLGSTPAIGYATSTDGISWTKDTLNSPVFAAGEPGQWDAGGVYSVSILLKNDTLHMWYGGGSFGQIGYATSPDGINWTRNPNNPVLNPGAPGSWDDQAVQQPVVLLDGDTLRMWYHGTRDFNIFKIGYATSLDGVVWTKNADNPVLEVGGLSEWDSRTTWSPFVIKKDTMFQMWYTGSSDGQRGSIGYATSIDGVTWTKFNSNPVLGFGNPGEWDIDGIGSPTLVFNDPTYHIWYFGVNNNIFGTGYATSTVTTNIFGTIDIPERFSLSQNYPNPFNPTTTIEFSLPQSGFVTLKVYNILGEEVATLVSKELNEGKYKYEWNANSLASGVYLFRIKAGKFQAVKKMILMK